MKTELILIGGGGHCRSVIDVIESADEYKIVGIIDVVENIGTKISGYPIIGCDEDLPELFKTVKNAIITLGQIKTPAVRIKIFENLMTIGYSLPAIVSARAYVAKTATIGAGSVIMHDALVNAYAKVGQNCIVNSKALVEHDAIIEDHCHISTGAIVNGGAIIKCGTFFGSNAVSRQGAVVEENAFVKAGSLVL